QAGADFADVVLEAPEAGDRALVNFTAGAADAGAGAPADDTVGDVRAGDVAFTGDADDLPDGGVADDLFFVFRFDLTADHALHVFDEVVDDAVRAQLDALPFRGFHDAAGGVHPEGEHAGVGGAGEQQVALGGGAHFGEHYVQVDFFDSFGF